MNAVTETLATKLQPFAQSNDLSKDVFRLLADRERSAARSDIDAIFRELEFKKKIEIDYFKYLDVWKGLETMGAGTLVHGRKGNPNRFVWHANLRQVGRIALGLPSESPLEQVKPVEKKIVEETRPKANPFKTKSAPKKEVDEPKVSTITFVIPSHVPMEEIKALIALGASLAK